MRKLSRILIILGLLWLAYLLYSKVIFLQKQDAEGGTADSGTLIITLFVGIVFIAVVIGGIAATWIIPSIGEFVGNFFFNPNVEVEKNPHSDALAKIAQGDYEGAIEEYRKSFEKNPDDTHALSEIIHIYCDKLHNHDAAEHFLEEALQKEWPPDQGAFLATRLVDIYWNYKRDATRARHVLQQIAETMPDTRHAANAVHRLHEIERVLADEAAGIVRPPSYLEEVPSGGEAPPKAPGEPKDSTGDEEVQI